MAGNGALGGGEEEGEGVRFEERGCVHGAALGDLGENGMAVAAAEGEQEEGVGVETLGEGEADGGGVLAGLLARVAAGAGELDAGGVAWLER